jgi:DNA-binding transcriptional LysR family regulator
MDLEALTDFNLVAAAGGIAQAARASGRPKASLSRRIMELEASLGVRLFERGSRSLRLTEEGMLLHARTSGPLADIAEAGELLRDGAARPSGRLRLTVPLVFGQMLMGRLAAEFTRAYPEVELDITAQDRVVDVVVEGYDVVIRVNPKPDAELVGRCFVRDRLFIVAAPTLSSPLAGPASASSPPVPAVRLATAPEAATWQVLMPQEFGTLPIRTVLRLPTLAMVRDATLTGIGAAKLPKLLVAEDLAAGRLVAWAAATDQPIELWVMHTSRRLASAKVKAFLQFLTTAFPDPWL